MRVSNEGRGGIALEVERPEIESRATDRYNAAERRGGTKLSEVRYRVELIFVFSLCGEKNKRPLVLYGLLSLQHSKFLVFFLAFFLVLSTQKGMEVINF